MPANAPERFAAWLSTDVGPVLRTHGFTKTGFNFHLRRPEGWGVINFQKSPWGSRAETQFTINLGVALDRLASIFDRDPTKKPPESMCHWSERIGWLLDSPRDIWWTLNDETDLEDLTTELTPLLLERALPAIEDRMTEEGFLRAMRQHGAIGQIPYQWKVLGLLDTGKSQP